MSDKAFDHARHARLLEEADRELTSLGRTDLAGAVRRASMIHTEFRSRVKTAEREVERLTKVLDTIFNIKRTLEDYVTKAGGPWIGPDLFPKESG